MKNKTKKIYVFEAAMIIMTLLLCSSINGQILISNEKNNEIEYTFEKQSEKQYLIYRKGMCPNIDITGEYKSYKLFQFGHIIGDIVFSNNEDFGPYHFTDCYKIYVKSLETGEIFSKNDLPSTIDIINFNGYGFFEHYDIPHGPWFSKFLFIGYAECILEQ